MSTELMWKSLEMFMKIMNKFWPHPMGWDPVKRRAVYISNLNQLKMWCFVMIFFVLLLSFGSSFTYLMKLILTKEPAPIVQIVIALLIAALDSYCCFAYFIMLLHGEQGCLTLNELIIYEDYLRKRKNRNQLLY